MKLNGIIGKGTGKLGSSVFAISGGVQIMREYNPVVSNPNTEAQIAQRAKLKLMSQLAASLAPAMGFAKMGLVSARNQFVSKNIGACTFANEEAKVDLTELQLTPSNVSFPDVVVQNAGGGHLNVLLASAAATDIKRVAYFIFKPTADNNLQYVSSVIVTEPGAERKFPTEMEDIPNGAVVYAYGIKDSSVNSTIRYNDYVATLGEEEVSLAVIPLFRTAGYALTKSVAVIYETT